MVKRSFQKPPTVESSQHYEEEHPLSSGLEIYEPVQPPYLPKNEHLYNRLTSPKNEHLYKENMF